jgi:hypothetical protein
MSAAMSANEINRRNQRKMAKYRKSIVKMKNGVVSSAMGKAAVIVMAKIMASIIEISAAAYGVMKA